MDEVEAINLKLSRAKNVWDVIDSCKAWRSILLSKVKKELPEGLRPYQVPLSNKMIDYTLTDGIIGNEIMSMWSRQCIDGETLVYNLDGGIDKIKDVGFLTGEKDVYLVKSTRGYRIISTLNHRFYTRNKGWRTLKEIVDNNKFPSGGYRLDWEVTIGDEYIKFNEEDYSITDDKIILLGYMLSDGYFKNKKQSFKFTNTNLDYIAEFKDCLQCEFLFKGNLVKKGRGWDLHCTDKKYQIPDRKMIDVKIRGVDYKRKLWFKGRNPFRNWLLSLKFKFGFPEDIYRLNKRQFGLFLNRMYASDGYIYVNDNVEIGLVDKEEKIKGLQMLLLKGEIHSYITSEPNGYSRIRVSGKYDVKKFLDLTGLIFGKEKQCLKALDRVKQITHRPIDDKWQSIKSIEYLGKRKTYNMHVPVLERYVANGFLVHNSGKTETVSFTALTLGTFYIIFLGEYFSAGLFAPVESMITHVTRNRLRKRFKTLRKFLGKYAIKQIAGEGQTSSLFVLENMSNDCEFVARSLSVGEHAETIGETFKLLVIEQSELVNAMKMKNDVFPMGAEKGGVRVLTGTTSPYFKNEYFKQGIERWNTDPKKNKSTADFVECVDWRTAAKSSRAYKRYVERELERMGEDSIEFRTQFGLEWVGTKLKFIGYEDLAGLEEDYEWLQDRLRFFGIDVAQAGDSTVVTTLEVEGGKRKDGAVHKHIIGWLELEGINYDDQIPKMVNFLYQYKPLRFGYIDIVSLGKPVYDILKRRLVEENPETEKPMYWARLAGYYGTVNVNHEINQAMDREFQHGRIHYPKTTRFRREKNRFIDQILDLERKYIGSKLKLEHPDIKGRHDDYTKSLGLAIWAYRDKTFKPGIAQVNL